MNTEPTDRLHPAAELFPMMPEDEFAKLVSDVRANGLRVPILLHPDGSILDGRHRALACRTAGVRPRFETCTNEQAEDPVGLVLSLNQHRRHLSSTQKACVAADAEELSARLAAEAAARRVRKSSDSVSQKIDSQNDRNDGKTTAKLAAVVGTNRQYVADAQKIKATAPELYNKMRSGEKSITEAKRDLKEQEREARREENRAVVAVAAKPEEIVGKAKFATIVMDPPWDWGDEGDADQLGRARPDYATMTFDQLMALPVVKLADDDCHLYLWITNRSLPKGFTLMSAWGFRYVTALTWCKPSFGMGNYFRGQTEHILFGVRGSQMLRRKDVGTAFHAKRGSGGHSSKPPEFLDLVESCSPGPYLEMFSRSERKDWTAWGEGSR